MRHVVVVSEGTARLPDFKVELSHDHTRYHPSLKPGVEGVTGPPRDVLSRISNEWVTVTFPEVTLEVRWRHLNITDPRWRSAADQRREEIDAAIQGRRATARVIRGSRGGLHEVVLTCISGRVFRVRDRKEGERIVDLLGEHQCEVEDNQQ
jgi:hypothetical protein